MCNPPFYESAAEMLASAKAKHRPPFSACTGAEVEMVTPGGEVALVSRMIQESLELHDRVEWYTSMLGKIASVSIIVEKLKGVGVSNWAVTEFVQGSKTRRWAVAWSWGDMRPRMVSSHLAGKVGRPIWHGLLEPKDVARGIRGLPKHLLPFPSEFRFKTTTLSLDLAAKHVDECMKSLEIQWQWKPAVMTGVGFAKQNVWSRAARRRRRSQDLQGKDAVENEDDTDEAALGFKVQTKQRKTEAHVEIVVRWLKGNDSVLFESFCGMLKRQLENK